MARIAFALALAAGLFTCVGAGAIAAASQPTNAADNSRTGWYPDQTGLRPDTVAGGAFGRLFSAPVTGQVYGQPLVFDGTLLVATEANRLYGLDPLTGSQRWTRDLGPAWDPADLNCPDLVPKVGVTSTSVVDPDTGTEYVVSKTYASGASGPAAWYLHAIDPATGDERPSFPVRLEGGAQNAPGVSFDATHQNQRPGLLLLDGVIYAGFAGHCDKPPYQGWIFGVDTGGRVRARWTSISQPGVSGAGIWQSGGGLVSDGPGQILVTTGNGGAPGGTVPGRSPPGNLGQSVVRLAVRPDGTLRATDFFAPYDAPALDTWDADFGSGGPVALTPPGFGTPSHPHLLVAAGKQGHVYLLDRDDLGGKATGPGGADRVVQRIGPYGGVWSRPAVWPGDGGYVYVPTASDGTTAWAPGGVLRVFRYGTSGTGDPSLALAATSSDAFGFSSGAPVVTSDGTASGSALVWLVWAPDGEGNGAQLRAYDAVPADGVPVLRFSAPVGASTKFSSPGVGGNRIYVGTRDGHVLGFGSPVDPTLTGPATSFGNTQTGASTQRTATLRAERDLTITSISTSSPRFAAGAASPALGTSLQAGDEVSVPVTFAPASSGPAGASLLVETSAGPASFSLAGVGLSPEAELHASPPIVSFGGATVGRGRLTGTVTLSNFGAQPLTIDSLELPAHPFSVDGAPAPGATIPPGAAIDLSVSFEPTSPGQFTDAIGLETSAGEESVGLSGSASPPGRLQVSPAGLDLGGVPLGQARAASLELSNTGGSPLTIMKSKPPAFGPFTTLWGLPEGSTIPPGAKLTVAVSFRPTALGRATDRWIVTADDDVGQRDISLTGEGVAPWAATPVAPAAAPPGALRFLSLRLSHSRLRTARSRARLPRSALVRYRLSAGATISLRVRRAVRRRGRTVWVAVRGSLIRRSATGAGSLVLHPRIGGHALPSGHYRLVASATGSGRTSGAPSVTRSFSVVG